MGNTLTSQPKTFSDERTRPSQRCSTHTLVSTFLCCISTSWAGQRSASTTMPSSLRRRAGWEKGDTFLERRRSYWLMLCKKCLFSSKAWSFYQAIISSTGRRLGSLDALKSRSAAIILHRTSEEIIPGISIHTCPLIFTSQRHLVWGRLHLHSLVLYNMHQEEKGRDLTGGIYVCICCVASSGSFTSLWFLAEFPAVRSAR